MTEKSDRIRHLRRFYLLLDELEGHIGGAKKLAGCTGRMDWPRRGIYFFRETGEDRTDTGTGPRIVRVGTHALAEGSGTKLWGRLSQHKGIEKTGGGNHRGSIFRLIVGTALMNRHGYKSHSWGSGSTAKSEIRKQEEQIEAEVSNVIRAMPFLWLTVEDKAGPGSLRGYIERNAIALLSNFEKKPLDAPSPDWLGRYCNREKVKKSGLWNQNHVDEDYDPTFLVEMETLISEMAATT